MEKIMTAQTIKNIFEEVKFSKIVESIRKAQQSAVNVNLDSLVRMFKNNGMFLSFYSNERTGKFHSEIRMHDDVSYYGEGETALAAIVDAMQDFLNFSGDITIRVRDHNLDFLKK
jgi:cell fate (sporulation/competence/biofilm development) regulator YlbF (YheA/YmcA/DUF963 family)